MSHIRVGSLCFHRYKGRAVRYSYLQALLTRVGELSKLHEQIELVWAATQSEDCIVNLRWNLEFFVSKVSRALFSIPQRIWESPNLRFTMLMVRSLICSGSRMGHPLRYDDPSLDS